MSTKIENRRSVDNQKKSKDKHNQTVGVVCPLVYFGNKV